VGLTPCLATPALYWHPMRTVEKTRHTLPKHPGTALKHQMLQLKNGMGREGLESRHKESCTRQNVPYRERWDRIAFSKSMITMNKVANFSLHRTKSRDHVVWGENLNKYSITN